MIKVALIAGARGVVGQPLCGEIERAGYEVIKVSRSDSVSGHALKWDMALETEPTVEQIDLMIHCAPIWVLPRHIRWLSQRGLKRLIAFSSSSVLSKQGTLDPQEKSVVQLLHSGEQGVRSECEKTGVEWTIFRPSMIYGLGLDQNVSRLARFIDRWGFAVVAGKANGLRQPVHSFDLVDAVIKVIDAPTATGSVYTLAGAEVLSYREMLRRIFIGLNKPARIIGVPVSLYRIVLRLAACTSHFAYTAEMANRMSSDLAYDNAPAIDDFAYAPAKFLEKPVRDFPDLLV